MDEFLRRLRFYFQRRRFEAELDEEMQHHISMSGRVQFGNATLLKEDSRSMWTWTWVEQLGQDLRYAVRTMIANGTFAALAVLSLALGIGANTAIYSFMDAILLRPLPVRDPGSLVIMKWRAGSWPSTSAGFSTSTGGTYSDPSGGMIGSVFPYPALELFQSNRDVLANAFCYFAVERINLMAGEYAESVEGQYVSGGYFDGMGVSPRAGRLISEEDDRPGAPAAAVLSYRYSERHFGTAAAAVGQTVRVNDVPFTVIGVTPTEFSGAEPALTPDVYVAMHVANSPMAGQILNKNYYWIEIMGRLKSGVSLARAQAALGPQFHRFVLDSAASAEQRATLPELTVVEGATGLDSLRHEYAKPLYILLAMVGLILAIACTNIANLLLARAAARRREIAVRLGIGASRARVIRQLLTESVLLASIGGALGIPFALWGVRVLTLLLGNGRENFTLHAGVNWNVLGMTLAVSLLCGVLFGVAPAVQATRANLMPDLRESRTGAPAFGNRLNLSRLLVIAQVAFSLLLLAAAGLFAGTLANLHSIEVGFNPRNVLLFTIDPPAGGYGGTALNRLYGELRGRLSRLPGVRNVSLSVLPLPSGGGSMAPIKVAGAEPPSGKMTRAGLFAVGPAFFKTMQIPLAGGREFNDGDTAGAPLAAVVNGQFAKAYGLENPVGRTFTLGATEYNIVGMVGDARFISMKTEFGPMAYLPYMQSGRAPRRMYYEVRTSGNPLDQAGTVRTIVRQMDPRIAVSGLTTQAAHIDQEFAREIALARLCGVFAVLALAITCVGLYGTTAYRVARRTGEIGIRMALGARRASVRWMVLREVGVLGLVGLAVGVPAAMAASHLVESFLFEIGPNDLRTLAGAAVALLAAVLAAAYGPARRASRIDPMAALRHE